MNYRVCLVTVCSFALVATSVYAADPVKPKDPVKTTDAPVKPEPKPIKTHIGDVTGVISKMDATSITIKVPTVTQSGTTSQNLGGGRYANVPKYTTKQVVTVYALSPDVTVKTVSGKKAEIVDVKTGETVRLNIYQVTERRPGEKAETTVVVLKIDVPDAVAPVLAPPAKPTK